MGGYQTQNPLAVCGVDTLARTTLSFTNTIYYYSKSPQITSLDLLKPLTKGQASLCLPWSLIKQHTISPLEGAYNVLWCGLKRSIQSGLVNCHCHFRHYGKSVPVIVSILDYPPRNLHLKIIPLWVPVNKWGCLLHSALTVTLPARSPHARGDTCSIITTLRPHYTLTYSHFTYPTLKSTLMWTPKPVDELLNSIWKWRHAGNLGA